MSYIHVNGIVSETCDWVVRGHMRMLYALYISFHYILFHARCTTPSHLVPQLTGFLTRDSRIVKRKKPGKAKARKSFQRVKR
ncbi:28S ribosomal protein S9, mitochondrial [Artemisia annua]|uniref:28S ribosomal protein S9, mitochondrial n=1 Tax=Artemisia annua TaxID=35608 RepID=A0A2U1PQ10_ARTAN|nr:28S ribosomal protein S9, mitochondrial [Artemisia annua]